MQRTLVAVLCFFLSFVSVAARELSFEDRVRAQEAIERVYYSHQIGATKPFEQAVPREVIERKVRDALRKSVALDRIWGRGLRSEDLRQELQRIARATRLPERLSEIYGALGNDAFLIQETLVRSVLADRRARDLHEVDLRHLRTSLDWDAWWGAVEGSLDPGDADTVATDGPIPDSAAACGPDDTWSHGPFDFAPWNRVGPKGIWTGTQFLVFGGADTWRGDIAGRYDPALDAWLPTTRIGVPTNRQEHSVVWTGSVAIIWGGREANDLNSGGRYDPVADVWLPTSTVGSPSARRHHSAVWTGSEMIVWGGTSGATTFGDGARYDPSQDAWTPLPSAGAPAPRQRHVAVWTGSEMLVWGGSASGGGRFAPATGAWFPMSTLGAPPAVMSSSAVWTGSTFLVWGGSFDSGGGSTAGGRYDPSTDTWQAMSTIQAPFGRAYAGTVWTGSRMVVWGGCGATPCANFPSQSGGIYDPVSDVWQPTSLEGAPPSMAQPAAVWTGTEMLVWASHPGGRFDPTSNTWLPMRGMEPSFASLGVWTGSVVVYWGGYVYPQGVLTPTNTGRRYDPALDAWTPTTTVGAPPPLNDNTLVWSGAEAIVCCTTGGANPVTTGGRYDPIADAWTSITPPDGRYGHRAVWTGTEMIVWGGREFISPYAFPIVGYRYRPSDDSWSPTSTTGAPEPRAQHVMVWTGSRALVWGGYRHEFPGIDRNKNSGGLYDPLTDTWTPMTLVGAPPADSKATFAAVAWDGSSAYFVRSGARYVPATDEWAPISMAGAPEYGGAFWTGADVLFGSASNPSARYDPLTDTWRAVSASNAPSGSGNAVWIGTGLLEWHRTTTILYHVDNDADGACGTLDNCALVENPAQQDLDGDGRGDACDSCPSDFDPVFVDLDADGLADVCDPDDDGDAAPDSSDNCPRIANASQLNADGDAFGDACDACILDSANDADADGWCANVDNCPSTSNPNQSDGDFDARGDVCDNCASSPNAVQRDTDADSIGDLCDNCPSASNVAQTDGDGDGSGDACDCQPLDPNGRRPAEVGTLGVSRSGGSITLSWAAIGSAERYSVTRGDLATKGASQYGPCQANGITATDYTDPQVPSPGQGWTYLVQAQNFDCGMGSLGTTSSEAERVNTSPGACGGVVVTDTRATSESSVFGTVSGTFTATQSSNNTYEAITEVLSSGGNPGSRFSQLEHRWTVSIGSGNVRQLHVEGFRSSSTDGDDFRFEWSTNGTTWTPVTMASLPLSDDAIDLIGTLPSGATGSVTIRVVDTNRAAGTQAFDTVTIDELFVRTTP